MTVSAWRIVRKEHLAVAFTGEGAQLYPGRWNSPGVSMVYTAGSISLAMLEILVHLRGVTRLPEYRLVEVRNDESLVADIEASQLPRGWRRYPPPAGCRRLGDEWARQQRSAVLRVPSVITGEPNYLLNPAHLQFADLEIGKAHRLALDARLLPESLQPQVKPRRKR